jgi:putative transposase
MFSSFRNRETLEISSSNSCWLCDFTRVDLLLTNTDGSVIGCPWLTTIVDLYSECVISSDLNLNPPSFQRVALTLRHAILPKQYSSEYGLQCEWGTYGVPQNLLFDSTRYTNSDYLNQIATRLGFTLRRYSCPSERGIIERIFGTLNTEFFEPIASEECLTLRELERLLVRYIVDDYNQRIHTGFGNQSRFQRWEAGLINPPTWISERELDICLMKHQL